MAPKLPRVQDIVLPILRDAGLTVVDLDDDEHDVTVNTWVPDIDHRKFPFIEIRRLGGPRHNTRPTKLGFPVIEMTAYTSAKDGGGLQETEDLYEEALEALYEAVDKQITTPAGYLHSIREPLGTTQFSSLFQSSWRVQGLIRLGIRPPRTP